MHPAVVAQRKQRADRALHSGRDRETERERESMVRILSSGEIVADDDPRAAATSRPSAAASSSSLPNAPLPSPPVHLTHRRRAQGSGQAGRGGSEGGSNARPAAGAGGVQLVHRDSAFLGLPDVDFLGTRFQGAHVLVVVGSFFFIGWRAIFVALLVWCMATQPGAQQQQERKSGGDPRSADPALPDINKKLFTGKGHRLGS